MAVEQDAGALLTLEDIRVFGPAQRRLFALCALMWGMSASFWFTGMQFLLPAVKGKWGLPSRWQGLYASVFYSGMVVGGVVFGRMADRHGRRPVLLACVAMAGAIPTWPMVKPVTAARRRMKMTTSTRTRFSMYGQLVNQRSASPTRSPRL